MGTCLWKVSLSSSQQTHFEKQNKEQPYNQALWNSQTLLSGRLLKGWRRIPRNCNSTPRDRDACGSREMRFQRSLVYQTLMHHALLFSLTLFFGKLNHLSPPIAFSVLLDDSALNKTHALISSVSSDTGLTCGQRNRGTCPPCYCFKRPGRGSHNTTHQTMQTHL